MSIVTPCLWFDKQGLEAAELYTSVVKNSRIVHVTHDPRDPSTVLLVTFELDGRTFTTLNGGPEYTHSPAISLEIECDDQDDVDRCWNALSEGGEEGPCGWLTDRYGVSWQIVPRRLKELLSDETVSKPVMEAMLQMGKIDIAGLEEAAAAAPAAR